MQAREAVIPTTEYLALAREWARLQQRVDALCRAHAERIGQLERELLRLRADRVLRHTQMLWGLGYKAFAGPAQATPSVSPTTVRQAADALICQTGCIGQAHAWLAEEQQCRLHGGPCGQLAGSSEVD